MYQSSRSCCDWPLPLSAGRRERREEGKGEESDGRARESELALGVGKRLFTHLVCGATSLPTPAVLDTASISLELSDTNIHK